MNPSIDQPAQLNEAFDAWASYYDLVHPGLPGEDVFYAGNALRRGGRVLELGCGTGRIAIPMAMSGLHVTGLDSSAAMLRVCREKMNAVAPLAGTLELVQGDMRVFAFDDTFDTIILAYRTFMHLLQDEDQRACLHAVRRALAPEGVCMLNVWIPPNGQLARMRRLNETPCAHRETFPLDGTGETLVSHHSHWYDLDRQIVFEEYYLQEVDAGGAVNRAMTLPLVRRWLSAVDMLRLADACGLRPKGILGGFNAEPYTPQCSECILVLAAA